MVSMKSFPFYVLIWGQTMKVYDECHVSVVILCVSYEYMTMMLDLC